VPLNGAVWRLETCMAYGIWALETSEKSHDTAVDCCRDLLALVADLACISDFHSSFGAYYKADSCIFGHGSRKAVGKIDRNWGLSSKLFVHRC
jgi:hypothetical protein